MSRKNKVDYEKAEELFRQGYAADEIACELGCAGGTIRTYLRKAGLTGQSVSGWTPDIGKMKALRAVPPEIHRWTYAEIARDMNVSVETVKEYLGPED